MSQDCPKLSSCRILVLKWRAKTPGYALSLSLLTKCGLYPVGETTEDYRDTHWAPVRLHIVTVNPNCQLGATQQPRWPGKNVSIGDCL